MNKTINRRPISVPIPASRERYFNHVDWKGINTNKNAIGIDQQSFVEAENVYINTQNILTSRPPIITYDQWGILGEIINTWEFGKHLVVLTCVKSMTYDYFLYFVHDNILLDYQISVYTPQLTAILLTSKIFILSTTLFSAFDIVTNTWEQDATSYIYIPVNDEEENLLAKDAHTSEYNWSSSSTPPWNSFLDKTIQVKIDGVVHDINYQVGIEKTWLGEYASTHTTQKIFKARDVNTFAFLENGILWYSSNGINYSFIELDIYTNAEIATVSSNGDSVFFVYGSNTFKYVMCCNLTTRNIFQAVDGAINSIYSVHANAEYDYAVVETSALIKTIHYKTPFNSTVENFTLSNNAVITDDIFIISQTFTNISTGANDYMIGVVCIGNNSKANIIKILQNGSISSVAGEITNQWDYEFFNTKSGKLFQYDTGMYGKIYTFRFIMKASTADNSMSFLSILDRTMSTTHNGHTSGPCVGISLNILTNTDNAFLGTDFNIITDYEYITFIYPEQFADSLIYDRKSKGGNSTTSSTMPIYLGMSDTKIWAYSPTSKKTYVTRGIGDVISISTTIFGTINYKYFTHALEWSDVFLANGRDSYIMRWKTDSRGIFTWYLTKSGLEHFNFDITGYHILSNTELAVFHENEIWYVVMQPGSVNSYYYLRSKLPIGVKQGSSILTTFDGKYILFSTVRGLVALQPQQFLATTEQAIAFLSDDILDSYDKFNTGPIKLYQYKYWVVIYSENSEQFYLLDMRNQSWWTWTTKYPMKNIVTYNEVPLFLTNNQLSILGDYDNYTDNGDEIKWKITSQMLHFDAINNYKQILSFILNSVDTEDKFVFSLQMINYRKESNTRKKEVFEYDIDTLRTFIKRMQFSKVNEFQYQIKNADKSMTPVPLKLTDISIKYIVTERVR